MKQETIEEVAEKIRQESFMCCSLSATINYVTVGEREKSAFIRGVKWQQELGQKVGHSVQVERMYNSNLLKLSAFIDNEDNHTEGEMGNSCIDVQTLKHFIHSLIVSKL